MDNVIHDEPCTEPSLLNVPQTSQAEQDGCAVDADMSSGGVTRGSLLRLKSPRIMPACQQLLDLSYQHRESNS